MVKTRSVTRREQLNALINQASCAINSTVKTTNMSITTNATVVATGQGQPPTQETGVQPPPAAAQPAAQAQQGQARAGGGADPPGPPGGGGGAGGPPGQPGGGGAGQPPAQANPQPVPFALTPGQLQSGVIDYRTKEGKKIFEKAIEPLPDKYDGSAGGLALFLSQLETKATNCGWNNGFPTEDIINLPTDPNRPAISRNLLQEHAQFSVVGLTAWELNNLIGTQDKRAQNNYNMLTCLKASLAIEMQETLDSEWSSYTVGGNEIASLYLLALIAHAEPGTHATVALVRTDLTNLDVKMLELDSDIDKFNQYVRQQKRKLIQRQEQTTDLLVNLFKGYAATRDAKFVQTISKAEEDYLHGKLPNLTDETLMVEAHTAYKVRKEKGIWGKLSPDQELIVAMKAQLEELSDKRLKLSTQSGNNEKTKELKKKLKNLKNELKKKKKGKGADSNDGKWAWKNKNPDNKKKMSKNGKTYYWCPYHNDDAGMWVLHKPENCNNKPDGEEQANDEQASNMANRAIAEMENDSDSGESETDSSE